MSLFFALCLFGLPSLAIIYDFYNEEKVTARLQKMSGKVVSLPSPTTDTP